MPPFENTDAAFATSPPFLSFLEPALFLLRLPFLTFGGAAGNRDPWRLARYGSGPWFETIFQGLAIALMAGEIASLLLSWMTVPVSYYVMNRRAGKALEHCLSGAYERR